MESTDLRFFEIVARAGNLTHAAERLNTVQSNVTARIKRLEDELGVVLLQRHSRGVSLTPAGEELLPFAIRVGQTIEEARKALSNGNGRPPRGLLRIGTLETTAAVRLPAILMRFAEECPQVEVSLRTGTSRELRDEVIAHRIDGAFVAGCVKDPKLTQTVMWEEELVMVGPESFHPRSLRDAAEVRVLVFRNGCSYRTYLEAFLANSGVTSVRQVELGTLEGIIGCVAAGMGLTMLPKRVVEESPYRQRLSIHKLAGIPAKVPTVFVHRADLYVSSALGRFIQNAAFPGREQKKPLSRSRAV